MDTRHAASQLRQEIRRLLERRNRLEDEFLRPVRMMAASLIERHLGTSDEKRASCAFYLSVVAEGKTRLIHVPKPDLEKVQEEVKAWRTYRAALRQWSEATREIGRLLKRLGAAQARRPGEAES
jgi:hypothetical protein